MKEKKYLRLIEYSLLAPHKIPERKQGEFDCILKNSIIRTKVCDEDTARIQESFTIYNEAKVEDRVIPLKDVIIYDNKDVNQEQEIAYVFECPLCLNTIMSSSKDIDLCPRCENTKFVPELIALINVKQMEDIAINDKENSSLIIVKDNEIVFKDLPENKEQV